MQITLKQDELEIAVKAYIQQMGITRQVGDVTFAATRGPEGITTTVEVGELSAPQKIAPIAPAVTGATPFAVTEYNTAPVPEPELEMPEMPAGKSLFGG